ncbi:MAG: aminomethyl-transferring glycine dehydrogenase subunit GcvPA [Desulfitobacteriaceae bacterium]|nr:aminomethyl-transferring glycine dehydrogenase subunit GcvPA [Desulfitobacteriaceae bacterium]
MSQYIANTRIQQEDMLKEMGLRSMEDLFVDIPEEVRLRENLNLPEPLSEPELVSFMRRLARKNYNGNEFSCFLGAGAYDHFIPSVVDHLISRQEFYTAYTPYQPEISQGTLRSIFEYQTMICELTGMDVANASMYDGASALGEAALMACAAVKRNKVLVARTVHPESREVINTYCKFKGIEVVEFGFRDGQIDLEDLESRMSSDTAAVIVQNPNFFGVIELLKEAGEIAHRHKALLIASVDPISLALLKPPGEAGADIVVGEGQSLGNPLNFGGPYLGFFAVEKKFMRKIPGRIVGETVDNLGRRGYVLTLQTREQHIRREKATSNICSNQALCALAATIYLTLLGKEGLKEAAELSLQKAHYTYDRLIKTGKFSPVFNAPFFKEFVVKSRTPVSALNKKLFESKIIGGYDLAKSYQEIPGGWLVAVTEKPTKEEIDILVGKAGEI